MVGSGESEIRSQERGMGIGRSGLAGEKQVSGEKAKEVKERERVERETK